MSTLPTGTVTFLLTDVEGSTAAWESDPDKMSRAVAELDALVEEVVSRHRGTVVKPRGEGDSHFCVFERATDGVGAGVDLLVALANRPLSVRASIHTGNVELRDGDYYGRTVNRAARLRSAGHGGQLLLSEATAGLSRSDLPDGVSLRDIGSHRLKDLSSPENIFQVVHPDFPDVRIELDTLDQARSNLPYQVTPLIGREEELAEVGELLRKHRLVTLVALGGAGKTRMALQAAAESSDTFTSGVRLADLATVSDPSHLADTVLVALGAPPSANDPLTEAIEWIGERPILLVLDNCEHLRDPVARAVDRLLAGCPRLAILATSRRPLELAAEQVYRVPSLPMPESTVDLVALARVPSVRLFLDRARQADPDFELQASNVDAVVGICRRLDGLPLALELAAARVKVLEPSRILERLDRQMTRVSPRPSGDANRTVASAIAWSYEQLTAEAAALLRRISILEGPRDLDCIERIAGLDPDEVADALAELVDHSLLVFAAGPAGRRYRLLELVRSFASGQLDERGERSEAERARVGWIHWLTGLAEDSPSKLDGHAIDEARADFWPALSWAEANEPGRWPVLANAVAFSMLNTGRPSEALLLFRRVLKVVDANDREDRLVVVRGAALAAFDSWEARAGVELARQWLELLTDPSSSELGDAHNCLGTNAWRAGDLELANRHLEEVFRLASADPDDWQTAALAANNLGLAAADTAKTMHWYGVQLEIERAHGMGGDALYRMGETAAGEGRVEAAVDYFKQALELPCRWSRTSLYELWGLIELKRGQLDLADSLFREALHPSHEGFGSRVSSAVLGLAAVALARGDRDACEAMVAQAPQQIGPDPAAVMDAFYRYGRRAEANGAKDLALILAQQQVAFAQRDAPAKHLAVALYFLARSEQNLGLPTAPEAARRAQKALADAGEGEIAGRTIEYFREAADALLLDTMRTAVDP